MHIEIVEGALVRVAGRAGLPQVWAIHGFGESSLVYSELLATPLTEQFQVIAPDLPGFGSSPAQADLFTVDAFAFWLAGAIQVRAPHDLVGLIGHSVGSIIAVRAATRLGDRVPALVSIEGNLTADDAYFSGQASAFDGAEAFREHFLAQIGRMATQGQAPHSSRSLWRYYASLHFADPTTLHQLGRDVKSEGAADAFSAEYLARPAEKSLYLWSAESTTLATKGYLRGDRISNQRYDGGHWPMIDSPVSTATLLAEFFQHRLGTARE